jgi:hypothetical protein
MQVEVYSGWEEASRGPDFLFRWAKKQYRVSQYQLVQTRSATIDLPALDWECIS